MNNDEIVWQIVGNRFCSFRVKTNIDKLCRNEYNLTGICNMQSCPLANSQYATVKEHLGVTYLYVKTAERAHMPSKLWEKIKLPSNYTEALKIIDTELVYWPSWIKHKCKQRLTKIVQYLIRMRKLKLKGETKLVGIKKKTERRLKTREIRAEQVARLDKSIEKELLERLKSKAYGEDMPLNIKQEVWEQILADTGVEDQDDQDDQDDTELGELGSEFEMADEDEEEREYVSDVSQDSDSISDDFGDIEDFAQLTPKNKDYEYEYEYNQQKSQN
ncbi:hypothetical protein BB561_004621 [Smittium simulii]|uniref:Protein MAK16 n=1 Tax=Smittium simulii TaxID=133385 RepID=A0A2T9YF75_9FUNG|nr:hypothetical protein BB561_004621 [Smittium simulii]